MAGTSRSTGLWTNLETLDLSGETSYNDLMGESLLRRPHPNLSIALEDDDDEINAIEDDDEAVRELSEREVAEFRAQLAIQDQSLPAGHRSLLRATTDTGCVVEPGKSFELHSQWFIRVVKIFADHAHDIFVRGIRMQWVGEINDMLRKRVNEVCAVITAPSDSEGKEPLLDQFMVTIPLSEIIAERDITITNMEYPSHSYTTKASGQKYYKQPSLAAQFAELTCRWKYVVFYDDHRKKISSELLSRLRWEESDPGFRMSDVQLFKGFVGSERAVAAAAGDLPTYSDWFAGGGGAAAAAVKKGFQLIYAVEKESVECATLQENFRNSRILEKDVTEVCNKTFKLRAWMIVDYSHFSPPCDFWSSNHTRPGRNDPANESTIFVFTENLKKFRHRVVSIEQVPGLKERHRAYFNALIHQITEAGYSVSWKIANLAETGNAHARKRLIFHAACPGHPLPLWPLPTHGDAPGLQPFTTIHDALERMPGRIPPHMSQYTKKDSMPHNRHKPLRRLISKNGGKDDNHPDGGRSYNMQELALLAGFFPKHRFVGTMTKIRQMIGNAVPSRAWMPYTGNVMNVILDFNRQIAAELSEVIEIDDD